jgi:hypothetical protein
MAGTVGTVVRVSEKRNNKRSNELCITHVTNPQYPSNSCSPTADSVKSTAHSDDTGHVGKTGLYIRIGRISLQVLFNTLATDSQTVRKTD